MLLNIQPLHIDGLNCKEDVFFTVAGFFKREYQLAFSEAFNFQYHQPGDGQPATMGPYIATGNTNTRSLLEKYCGIDISTLKAESAGEIVEIIREQNKLGHPTAFSINTYWCPWSTNYQIQSFGHTCLAVDIDDENKITCLDPVRGLELFYLPYSQYENGFAFYSTFQLREQQEKLDYKKILAHSVDKISSSNMFENMERFLADFNTRFNFEEEFKNARPDIWGSLFYRNLVYVAGARYLYSQFINHINQGLQTPRLDKLEKDLLYACSKWKVAISWLLKGFYTSFNQGVYDRAQKTLGDIVKEEREIYKSLQQAADGTMEYRGEHKASASDFEKTIKDIKYTYIDLKDYCNNIAFHSTASNDCAADFTGTGHYFLSREAPSEKLVSLGNMSFIFPRLEDACCDNVSCSGQIIAVPSAGYKGIILMGSCEWGNFIENMRLNYAGGESETIQINFSDWQNREPLYDDKLIWGGKVYNKNEGRGYLESYNLFALVRSVRDERNLSSITLPECSNMHIFAMTLYK